MSNPAFLLDMDGVLYRGDEAIPGAREFLHAIREHPALFVTNNSSATPEAIAEKLARLGFPDISPERILTSAVATAEFLHRETPGFRYFAVGGPGLHEALSRHGTEDLETPDYVVVGEGPGLSYESLALGLNCLLRGRARLVGTNPDPNLDGTLNGRPAVLPGGGALMAPFAAAAGMEPLFIGKPEPWLFREGLRRLGRPAAETVMIGDRPDTDIKGAADLGLAAVLVRTGRFGRKQPYPKGLPKPDFDVGDLSELRMEDLLQRFSRQLRKAPADR
jgi:HAD superfamily hydrolase (TIGR01450 family)